MNKMKYVIPFLLSACIVGRLSAQEYKATVDNSKAGQLTLEDFPADVAIEGYSGTEIVITAEDGTFEPPDRAKGLKPVYSGGVDNTGIGLYMEKNGSSISFHCLLPITKSASYHVKVPENLALKIHRDCSRGGRTDIANMKNEVDFDGCHAINLKNVSGPLVISTINGEVTVVFTDISKERPMSIASINGPVDVTIPAKAGVNLVISTIHGNMYSDFDLNSTDKDMRKIGGDEVRAALNGGGTDLKLSTINANIYVRKGNQ